MWLSTCAECQKQIAPEINKIHEALQWFLASMVFDTVKGGEGGGTESQLSARLCRQILQRGLEIELVPGRNTARQGKKQQTHEA